MEAMQITVISARTANGHVRATIRAISPPTADIHLVLNIPVTGLTDIWAAARDEALKYLDVA